MASISDQLKENPAAKELLANQKAIRQLLADPETRKVLSSLQKKNSAQLQAAAQSALQGNSACSATIFLRNSDRIFEKK